MKRLYSHCVRLACCAISTVFLFLTPVQAMAEALTYTEESSTPSRPGWWISVGGGAITTPEFEGSHRYKVRFMPIVSANYQNRFFVSSHDGLGVYAMHTPNWNVGANIKYNHGRDENASPLLRGMGDIDPGADLGVFATWTPAPFSLRLNMLYGTGDVEGFEASLTGSHSMLLWQRLQWTNSVGVTYADDTRNDTFFGVSSSQSARSGYRRYDADSGFKSAQLQTRFNYHFTREISAMMFGQYKRLTGPAEDSPLVKAGSADQGTVGVGLVYTFMP